MKFPESKTGVTTMGLFGTSVFVLAQTGFMNPWWTVLGVIFVIAAIGQENGKDKS